MLTLETIPALKTWKMLSEVIQTMGTTSDKGEQLSKIVENAEMADMFVFPMPAIGVDEQKFLACKQHEFASWVLGQFFRLSAMPSLQCVQRCILFAQIRILRRVHRARQYKHVAEYARTLAQLNTYMIGGFPAEGVILKAFLHEIPDDWRDTLNLKAFSVPVNDERECTRMQDIILQVIGESAVQMMDLYHMSETTQTLFATLLNLLQHGSVRLKVGVLKIYAEVIQSGLQHPREIESIKTSMLSIFETLFLTRNVGEELDEFHTVARKIFENFAAGDECQKMYVYILDGKCSKFRDIALKYIQSVNFESVNYMPRFKEKIIQEIRQNYATDAYQEVYTHLKQKLVYIKTLCDLDVILERVEEFLEMILCIKYETQYILLAEEELFNLIVNLLQKHLQECHCDINLDRFTNILCLLVAVGNSNYTNNIFDWCTCLLSNKTINCEYPMNIRMILAHFQSRCFAKDKLLDIWCYYMTILSMCLEDDVAYEDYEEHFLRIALQTMEANDSKSQQVLLSYLVPLVSKSRKIPSFETKLLLPAMQTEVADVRRAFAACLPELVTALCVRFRRVIEFRENRLRIRVVDEGSPLPNDAYVLQLRDQLLPDKNDQHLLTTVLRTSLRLLSVSDASIDDECRVLAIRVLPVVSRCMPKFTQIFVAKWMEPIGTHSIPVRNAFVDVIQEILEAVVSNKSISDAETQGFFDRFFTFLTSSIDVSLRLRNELYKQHVLIGILDRISRVEHKSIEIHFLKYVLLFMIMASSIVWRKALPALMDYGRRKNTATLHLFRRYRPELCKLIVTVCDINLRVANIGLARSLKVFALEMGYRNVKHLFEEETRYYLPFFISLVPQQNDVLRLLEEIAEFNETDLRDLFADKYGYIYVHLTLNENIVDCEQCLRYVEKTIGESNTTLVKNNFMIILNELLLQFNEKRDRVLGRLTMLAGEDGAQSGSVRAYIQPRFLGVLQYFDMGLLSRYHDKATMLLSLAKLFEYMGPKYITPVRFKIIAILRTALQRTEYLGLNCEVWEAFIKSCDLEMLAPQLATICVSIYPLIHANEAKVNAIFEYLVVANQNRLKDNIIDLFFVAELPEVHPQIQNVINGCLAEVQATPFKQHLQFFMKYLRSETAEVQVHALKYIKRLIGRNQIELETLVLGFNGIDACVVELIDYLLQGCREYANRDIRLACGDCIGVMGAIEPSHLPPPQSVQEESDFTLHITESRFIRNSLNLFSRAMQAEANSRQVDAFALAIQETLSIYDISPRTNSENHDLWNGLTEQQKELMLPFVSSKYYCSVSNTDIMHFGPIYGTHLGSNIKAWLDNWTTRLVSALGAEKKKLFDAYIPSMKQDIKTLMYFLPQILLNNLTEGSVLNQQEAFNEFMAVINSDGKSVMSGGKKEHSRPIILDSFGCSSEGNASTEMFKREDYLKVLFVLFDFLERWLREWMWVHGYVGQEDAAYRTIKSFTARFSKYQLAKSNFAVGGYPRALMYLEDHITAHKDSQDEFLSLLSEIYFRLNEPDGVAGVAAHRDHEPSLEQRILDHEVSGQVSHATACYERLPCNLPQMQGLIKSQLDLDNANTSLLVAKSAWEAEPAEWILEAQAEPLWRLGRYDELDDLLKRKELEESRNWGVHTGMALIKFHRGDREAFRAQLERLKMIQIDALGAPNLGEGSYQHGYYYIARLHAINELEQIEQCVHELLLRPNDQNVAGTVITQMRNEWDLRLRLIEQNVKVVEPILCLRRAALEIARKRANDGSADSADPLLRSLLGDAWLKSAVIAMDSEFSNQAYSYLLKAEEYAPPRLFIEKAKWFWQCNDHERALTTLERQLRVLLPDNGDIPDGFPLAQRRICAEAKLNIAIYNDKISNVDVDVITQHYKDAIDMNKECEKSLMYLAQYYDRRFQTMKDTDKDSRGADIQIYMINFFGKSLQYGTRYVYQSMPRLLSIWIDYGTRMLEVATSAREERKQNLLKMTKLVDSFLDRLPPYIFLTAFSQIISRICHSQKEIYKELILIITKLILNYPQQSLWMMISVIKSSYTLSSQRCSEILSDSRLKTPTMTKFIGDFVALAEKLIELTNKEIAGTPSSVRVSTVLRYLPRMLSQPDFSEIMIPTHKFRKLILPSNLETPNTSYNPFPNHCVYIVGIKDEMTILPSLQRPRRITLRGSDGLEYIQMLKPKDDLRKDFRLMEFNDIVNQLLASEPEARQRRLNIRLYSVAPLNEECGLIEWIPNLVGLRPTLMTIYKQYGFGMRSRQLQERACRQSDTMEKKRDIYNRVLLPKHPPMLGEWFRRTFPDAHGWLTARTAYTRTVAVMSMVGHILGLGDRHGENILLDATSGDVVHVDFNCLFNKGEQFEWPERVPFRLTPNMVAAMGPLGVEGMFRKSCACTLHVLRTHQNTLMSIVTPFVYDPLVSWPKRASSNNCTNAERTNELAVEHIKVIQKRLQGHSVSRRGSSAALSIEGQTNKLIAEATSIDNLCQMYIGWAAYL